jgi:hypothetical protein
MCKKGATIWGCDRERQASGGGAEKSHDVSPRAALPPSFFIFSALSPSLLSPSQHTHTHTHHTRAPPPQLPTHASRSLSLTTRNKKKKMSSTRTSPPEGGAADTKMRPPADAGAIEKVASPLATLSSHVDPWPHYIMSAACGCSPPRPSAQDRTVSLFRRRTRRPLRAPSLSHAPTPKNQPKTAQAPAAPSTPTRRPATRATPRSRPASRRPT